MALCLPKVSSGQVKRRVGPPQQAQIVQAGSGHRVQKAPATAETTRSWTKSVLSYFA